MKKKGKRKLGILMVILATTMVIFTGCLKNDIDYGKNIKNEIQGDLEANKQTETEVQNDKNNNNVDMNEEKTNNDAESNTAEVIQIKGTKTIEDIEISNIQIKEIETNNYRFSADVKNLTDKFLESKNIEIRALNENGEVTEVFGGIISKLSAYEPYQFVTYVLADISDATDFEFVEIEK